MSKSGTAIFFLSVSIIAFLYYYLNLPPSDIEEYSGGETKGWIALITAIVSLLASILTFASKWLEAKQDKG